MPQRIQRKRTKGWQMPDGAICVSRPSRWGNPFRIGCHYRRDGGGIPRMGLQFIYLQAAEGYQDATYTTIRTNTEAVEWYRWYLSVTDYTPKKAREELRGKDLACWCRLDQPCHADVLLEIANA